MSAEPVVETRTRHENRSPLSSSKTRELLYSAGAIGIGALGGYLAVDYIIKSQAIEKFLAKLGITLNATPASTVPAGTDTQGDMTAALATANFAHYMENPRRPAEIFDRTTRVNSYAARQFNRKPSPYIVEGGIDITQFQTGIPQLNEINQVVTDDDVYDSF